MSFDIRILGANSAVPNKDRFPTCQCVSIHSDKILIDCGEGAQINLAHYKVKRSKIKTILISHLHGDHIYGLPGVLSSFSMNGRTQDLQIFGPVGLKAFINAVLTHTHVHLQYEITIHELDHIGILEIHQTDSAIISAFPMTHRIPTYGYLISEKEQSLNINSSAIETYKLNVAQIKAAKAGESISLADGTLIPNKELVHPKKKPRTYAYCSDTIYDEGLVPFINQADLLYHEATYLHDLQHKAIERKHATALEAAKIAKAAKVRKLIIGHYSSRYDDLQPLEDEAKSVFPNTNIVRQGDVFSIDN